MNNAVTTHYVIANFYHKEHEGKATKNAKTNKCSVPSVKDFVTSVERDSNKSAFFNAENILG